MTTRTNTTIADYNHTYAHQVQPELIHVKIQGSVENAIELMEEFISSEKTEPVIWVLVLNELRFIKTE